MGRPRQERDGGGLLVPVFAAMGDTVGGARSLEGRCDHKRAERSLTAQGSGKCGPAHFCPPACSPEPSTSTSSAWKAAPVSPRSQPAGTATEPARWLDPPTHPRPLTPLARPDRTPAPARPYLLGPPVATRPAPSRPRPDPRLPRTSPPSTVSYAKPSSTARTHPARRLLLRRVRDAPPRPDRHPVRRTPPAVGVLGPCPATACALCAPPAGCSPLCP